MELLDICKSAKETTAAISILGTDQKNEALRTAADFLIKRQAEILAANEIDLENGKKNHMPQGLQDRLLLTSGRIAQMAEGIRQVAEL